METMVSQRRFSGAFLVSLLLALSLVFLLVNGLLAADKLTDDTFLAPSLAINKQVDQATAAAGSTLAYTVILSNNGDGTANTVFTDTLPVELTYNVGSLDTTTNNAIETGVGVSGNVITWTGSIGPDGTATILFSAALDGGLSVGSTVTNTAVVTGTGSLLTDTAVTQIVDLPSLTVEKQVDQTEAEPGDTLAYTVVITNIDTTIVSAVFTDTLPAEVTYVANSLATDGSQVIETGIGVSGGVITWTGSLGVNGYVSIMFDAAVPAETELGTAVTNMAVVNDSGLILTDSVTTVITHVVPITKYAYLPSMFHALPIPTLQATTPDINNSWTLSWNLIASNVTNYRLEEAFDANFTNNVVVYTLNGNTSSKSVQHNPPASNAYYYRVRGEVNGNPGPWSNVVTVLAITDLNLKSTLPNRDNKWTVSWDSAVNVTYYELQESHKADFSSGVQSYNVGTATSKDFQPSFTTDNVYYYRVRVVVNSVPGQWSDTVPVIGGYEDSFGSSGTGWTMRRTDTPNYNIFYRSDADQLQIEVFNGEDYVLAAPMAPAVARDYEIKFEAKLIDPADRHAYGLAFGGNWDGTTTCPNNDYSSCFTKYYQLLVEYQSDNGNPYLEFKLKWVNEESSNQPPDKTLIDWTKVTAAGPADWNTWTVKVDADGDLKVLLGDTQVGSVRHDEMPSNLGSYFGLMVQTKSNGSAKARFQVIQVRRQAQ